MIKIEQRYCKLMKEDADNMQIDVIDLTPTKFCWGPGSLFDNSSSSTD